MNSEKTGIKVLVGCEESQAVTIAFRELGHEAYSCDLSPCSGGHPEWHLQMDVFEAIDIINPTLGIFHPPCTRLCNSGVRWLGERNLWDEMKVAADFSKRLLESRIGYKAIENPIPHRYAVDIIGRKYDQKIQPWMFGHGETKATCLWLENLPKLVSTNVVEGREQRIWKMPPGEDRGKERSKTYPGIAKAMAVQWSDYVLKHLGNAL